MKESTLYPPIKSWLEAKGFTVYAEVYIKESGRTVDVIGINESSKEIISIELKNSYSGDVHQQAQFNANLFKSFVAIPKPQQKSVYNRSPFFGLLLVDTKSSTVEEAFGIAEEIKFKPSFKSLKERLFLNKLNQEISAGVEITKEGLTAYQISLKNVKEFLKQNGPTDLKTIVKSVNLHWKNPLVSLRSSLRNDPDCGILIDTSHHPHKYYLKE